MITIIILTTNNYYECCLVVVVVSLSLSVALDTEDVTLEVALWPKSAERRAVNVTERATFAIVWSNDGITMKSKVKRVV